MENKINVFELSSPNGKISGTNDGCYITSWSVKNNNSESVDLLYSGSSIKRTGIPILFPQFGTALGMNKHGFGRESKWNIISKSSDSVSLQLTQNDITDAAKNMYPYDFCTTVTVHINDTGDMFYNMKVSNTGTNPLPISPGLHPYWRIPQNKKKDVTIDGISGLNATQIDWDANPPDTHFPYTDKITIHFPQASVSIEDITRHNHVLSDIVVWSQPFTMEDHNFICVEPVCGYNEALINHPIMIAPGKDWQMNLRFTATFHLHLLNQ